MKSRTPTDRAWEPRHFGQREFRPVVAFEWIGGVTAGHHLADYAKSEREIYRLNGGKAYGRRATTQVRPSRSRCNTNDTGLPTYRRRIPGSGPVNRSSEQPAHGAFGAGATLSSR